MKNIKIILVLALFFTSLNGCKDFLEEKPFSFVSPENFYKSDKDAELALTGVYDVLNAASIQGQGNHHMWGRAMHYLTQLGNDELVCDNRAAQADFVPYSNYTYTPETQITQFNWISFYAGINRANFIVEKVPGIVMDAVRKQQIIGEARFLRGLYYFYLGWLYGGVPVVKSTEINTSAPRNSLQEVMAQAELDFKFAYDNLPARNSKDGRVNKYTAAGFLAKLYIYLASCKENNVGATLNSPLNSFAFVNSTEMYDKANQYAQDVYSNSGYNLVRPYRDLFLSATEASARNEMMMIVQAGPGGNNEYILAAFLNGPRGNVALAGGTYGWIRPVRELYNRYNANDPRRANNFSGNMTNTNPVVINGLTYFTPGPVAANFSNLNLAKYREADPISKTSRGISNFAGETDFGILRFADIILTLAETRFKKGDEPGARALLREVRLRACGDNVTTLNQVTTAYLRTDFMQELMEERSRELCGEGWRRFDLIRTNTLKTAIENLTELGPPSGSATNLQNVQEVKLNFAEYKIFYPIPSRERELNKNLTQNVGYPQ
jgi:hypothetical protein